jgi:orotidine-5'-phosphate decarboxylase
MNFLEKLEKAQEANHSLLCVGLDPQPELMPTRDVAGFCRAIIEATSDLVSAYKPNLAFYEALGLEGLRALEKTLSFIPSSIPVIGDAKRADVGHSARAYARALFDVWNFDAVTVNPYLGYDSLEPFLEHREKGVFVLARTSNRGAEDFQELSHNRKPLYQWVALKARDWNRYGNIGLVAGATYPRGLCKLRQLCPGMLLLIPGIGAQGGDLGQAVACGLDAGGKGAIFSTSREVLYASRGDDFALRAREKAGGMRAEIERLRSRRGQ